MQELIGRSIRDIHPLTDAGLVDSDGNALYCDAEGCCARARHRVAVSVNKPHDDTRAYCGSCYGVYLVGVQHGRFHEAAQFVRRPDWSQTAHLPAAAAAVRPGRDSSQDPGRRE